MYGMAYLQERCGGVEADLDHHGITSDETEHVQKKLLT
jgi:hypothetical protein